jgi:hypothetical protein
LFRLAFLRSRLWQDSKLAFRGAREKEPERIPVSDDHFLELY